MLPAFLACYPDVRVVLDTENRVIDLAREEADIEIRVGPLENSDLIARKLASLSSGPTPTRAISRRMASRTAADFADHKLFGWSDGPSQWPFATPD